MYFASDIRFPVQNPDGYDESRLSDEHLNDLHSTTYFSLHLRVQPEHGVATIEDVQAMADAVHAADDVALVGLYTGGDSFLQWAEAFEGDEDGRALHVLLTAPDLAHARAAAARLAGRAGITSFYDATLSMGSDWSVQTEIWPEQVPDAPEPIDSTNTNCLFAVTTGCADGTTGKAEGLSRGDIYALLDGTLNNIRFREIIIRPQG